MEYTVDNLDRIVEFKTWSNKQKIDEMLRINTDVQCNLGTDSTKAEKEQAKKDARKIYIAIKKVDYALGQSFLNAMDTKRE